MIAISGRRVGVALLVAAATFIALAGFDGQAPSDLLAALVAAAGSGLTVILVPDRPVAAVGVLFVLASVSGVLVPLPFGRVRLEQPAVLIAVVVLALSRRWPRRSEIRAVLPVAGAFVAYLAVLTLASVVKAPRLDVSARMITWTTLSMAAGAVSYTLLVRSRSGRPDAWFVATGVGHAAIGLAIAVVFLILGPAGIAGMQTSPGEAPKVAGLAFEANLFASMLAAIAPFAFERFRVRPTPARAAAAIAIVVGTGLGVTRGAYLGLGVGLLVYLGILTFRSRWRDDLLRVAPIVLVAVVLAPSVAFVTLPITRPAAGSQSPDSTASTRPKPSNVEETATPGETPSPGPTIAPSPSPQTDTLTFRTTRIPTALADLRASPLIGLGAASYGQRHEMIDRPGTPDYIGILALVALYESGIVGAAALGAGFALGLLMLLRLSRNCAGPAAAYAAALVSLLVSYQATNALFFAINWIFLGAGLALAVRDDRAARPEAA